MLLNPMRLCLNTLALILLYSLLEKYSQFTNSFIYGRDSISLSDVKAGMICEEQRIQMKIGNNSRENNHNSHGLFAERDQDDQLRGRTRGRSQSRKPGHRGKSKQRGNCNYCHKPGHWVRDCPSLKNKDKTKAESSAVAAEHDTGFSAMVTAPQGDRRWVLDTGASCHMTPFRDCFTTFEEF
ncbi:hypothetical protein L6452_40121 [Arctium lappa]|uniref:Uncharacterized protein n=1 Tax=Arctium lappa TaxID=4217 RepID=A0ACB8XM74_ARCLA|nr:hypothetical protein L6452_40121 [Arctium lappa]